MWSVLSNPHYLVPALCLAEPLVQDISVVYRNSLFRKSYADTSHNLTTAIFEKLAEYALTVWVAGHSASTPLAAAVCVVVPRQVGSWTYKYLKIVGGRSVSASMPYGELSRVAGICGLIIVAKSTGEVYASSNDPWEQACCLISPVLMASLNEHVFLSYENFSKEQRQNTQQGIWALSILTRVGLTLAGADPIAVSGFSTAITLIVHGLAKRYWAIR